MNTEVLALLVSLVAATLSVVSVLVARRSAKASDRSADAAVEANELTKEALRRDEERNRPKPVEWQIEPGWILRNVGTETARNVRVHETSGFTITGSSLGTLTGPFDLPKDAAWRFSIATSPHTRGGWELLLTWDGQDRPVSVAMPPSSSDGGGRGPSRARRSLGSAE